MDRNHNQENYQLEDQNEIDQLEELRREQFSKI
jgi:hypothetical protein